MLLHYPENALSASCTWNHWLSPPINTRLYSAEPVASKYPRFEPSRVQDLGYHAKSCKSVTWMNGGWSTSGVALKSRLSTWLLYTTLFTTSDSRIKTTSVEDFERASIRKEDNSNTTCELAILTLSVSVTLSVTFVWMLPCYIFYSKSMRATPTITPTRVFVLKGSATAKLVCGDRFYSMLRRRYLLSDMPKKNIKIGQQLPKLQQTHIFWLAVSRARCAECIFKVVQQHNLGDVANSITRFTETS